ncbi:MAG TPA: DNA-directed RNA polymerase subunit beta [Bacillales bacterium]|nr:DNA-directed RNA polymerase subunit beta [Bacillales bacterium]
MAANQQQPKTREEYKRLKLEKERLAEQARLEEKKLAEQARLEQKLLAKQATMESKQPTIDSTLASSLKSNKQFIQAKFNSKIEPKEAKQGSKAEQLDTTKRIKIRLVPIWLRIVILVCLIVISTTAGALVGYGPLGGGKATDVLKESTWTHIVELVEKNTK